MTAPELVLDELDRSRAAWQVPGAQVVVVQDGSVLHAGGLGALELDQPTPVDGTTVFEHGSCAKAYTAALALRLADEGLVDLDAPVRQLVPELTLPDQATSAAVTLRDLLSHRSGLGRHDPVWILDGRLERADVVRRLADLPLGGPLRGQWTYSNLGYALAGAALERAAGSTWEELVASRLLRPLGMRTARVDGTAAGPRATGYLLGDDGPVPAPARRLGAVAPAGQLTAAAGDAAAWLLAQTSDQILQRGHEPVADMAQPSPLPELELDGYGLGWVAARFRGARVAWHSGGVDGFLTQTLVAPESRSAVLVSATLHLTGWSLAAALTVLERLLGQPAGDWFERLRPPAGTPSPAPLLADTSGFAGCFTSSGYGRLVVAPDGTASLGDASLVVHQDGEGLALHYPRLQTSWPLTVAAEALTVAFDETGPTRFER